MGTRLAVLALILSAALFSACGDDEEAAESAAAPAADEAASSAELADDDGDARDRDEGEPRPEPEPGPEIIAAESQFGDVVFDADNQAIYYFDLETDETPQCYDDCAAAWPPVLTEGEPVASGSIEQDLLGTVERDDGTTQVTYAGRPLYFYAHEAPGEVRCHNVPGFGGLWLAVLPNGDPVPI